jgi:hypothetical protein
MDRTFRIILLATALILQCGCSWEGQKKPSILVIAIDSLGFRDLSCSESSGLGGFRTFCEESIRFTHAYTPSVLAQPAMASLLTGRYPLGHRIWHNGSQFLSGAITTAPEEALKRGYRTAFFSGGPPIFRKSGFAQGFETFDDYIEMRLSRYYRPAKTNFEKFNRWLKGVSGKPFMAFIYLPDLQFVNTQTADEEGRVRSYSYEGQLNEIGESLDRLVKELKRQKRWSHTHVIVAGLNGRVRERASEIKATNLYSENSQVKLFVKPATKERDLDMQWKVDKNVSLVDIGFTLFDILGVQRSTSKSSIESVVSLTGVLKGQEAQWPEDRSIVVESGWAQWRGIGQSRFAVRKSRYLFMYDKKPMLFNSLTDRLEVSPLSQSDLMWSKIAKATSKEIDLRGYSAWEGLPQSLVDKLNLAQKLWRKTEDIGELQSRLQALLLIRRWDQQVVGWLASSYLEQENWAGLRRLGEKWDKDIWVYVADMNTKGSSDIRRLSNCEAVFLGSWKEKLPASECENDLFLDLIRWKNSVGQDRESRYQERFLRKYVRFTMDLDLAKMNYLNALSWDVNLEVPSEPSLSALYLRLPASRRLRRVTEARMEKSQKTLKSI